MQSYTVLQHSNKKQRETQVFLKYCSLALLLRSTAALLHAACPPEILGERGGLLLLRKLRLLIRREHNQVD